MAEVNQQACIFSRMFSIIVFASFSHLAAVGRSCGAQIAQTFSDRKLLSFSFCGGTTCSIAVTQWLDDLALKPNQKFKETC